MIDLKKEKVEVTNLALGMYVAELDRPWIGTPFLLQGFLLDDLSDISTLKTLCSFVYIDRTKSIGDQFVSTAKQNVAFKREGSTVKLRDPSLKKADDQSGQLPIKTDSNKKSSFLEQLINLNNQKNTVPKNQSGTVYNLSNAAHSASQAPSQPDSRNSNFKKDSFAQQVATGIGGFFGGLFKRNESANQSEAINKNKKNPETYDDAYHITIFEEEPPVEIELAKIVPVYEQSQIATRHIFESIANEQHLDLTAVSEILDNMVESIGRTPDALLWLAKLKKTDDYAYNHALNVSITMMAFGNFLALSKPQIKELGLAGLLQDVGKVKISPDILLKEGKLTREEFEYAKKHVDESRKILEATPDISDTTIFLVAQHHERIDGSGYPYQLKDHQIGLMSQVAGLIDTYCAITTHKCYAKGVYHQQALDQIHQLSGNQFSSDLVDQLIQFMGMYPVSSLVELNTGEVAVVLQQNQVRRLLPRLMLLLDSNKERYNAPVILNLLNSPNTPAGEPYKIVRSLDPDSFGLNPNDFYV